MILILIHHIHFLMYVPTIVVIVVLRYYLVQGFSRQNATVGTAAIACIGVLFVAAQFWGSPAGSEAEFVQYLQSRMAAPTQTSVLSFSYIWYRPLSREVHDTWDRVPSNLLGIPVFALLIWLHAPPVEILCQFDRVAYGGLASPRRHRRHSRCEPRLSHHVRDRVRLFAMDLELGGLHVPDLACGKNPAKLKGRDADLNE